MEKKSRKGKALQVDNPDFGDSARRLIKNSGKTTEQVADYLGVSVSSLNQQLNGNPATKTLRAIAEFLKCDIMDFFRDEARFQGRAEGSRPLLGLVSHGGKAYAAYDTGDLRRIADEIDRAGD